MTVPPSHTQAPAALASFGPGVTLSCTYLKPPLDETEVGRVLLHRLLTRLKKLLLRDLCKARLAVWRGFFWVRAGTGGSRGRGEGREGVSYSNSTKMVYQPERRVSGGEFPHTLFSTLQSASTRSRLGQGVQGEHFWGVAGAELEGYVNHLLRIGSGGRVLLCSVKKNNSDNVEKNFIWPKRYMTIVPVTRLEGQLQG